MSRRKKMIIIISSVGAGALILVIVLIALFAFPSNNCQEPNKLVDGVCLACASPSKWVGDVCKACASPNQWVGDVCEACASPKKWVGTTCKSATEDGTCGANQETLNGVCVDQCSEGETRHPTLFFCQKSLECPGEKENFNGFCVEKCPTDWIRNPTGICAPLNGDTGGALLDRCSAGEQWWPPTDQNGTCVKLCPPLETRISATECQLIECPPGTRRAKNGQCLSVKECDFGQTLEPDGTCKEIECQPDEELNPINQTCRKVECQPGQAWDTERRACIPNDFVEPTKTFEGVVGGVWSAGPVCPPLRFPPYNAPEISREDTITEAVRKCNANPICFGVISTKTAGGTLISAMTGPAKNEKIVGLPRSKASGLYFQCKEISKYIQLK